MKTLGRALATTGMFALAMFLVAVPAQAALFSLNNWNETHLDASTARVDVNVTFDVGTGNTTIVVTFVQGNFPLVALGIDQFGYQNPTNSAPGTTSGWNFTNNGNMDGFNNFQRQAGVPSGDDLTFQIVLLGNQTIGANALDSAADFAAHVRFSSTTTCSGFVGGGDPGTPGTAAGCGTVPVPEPATLALLGSGLVGLGIVTRRKWMARRASF